MKKLIAFCFTILSVFSIAKVDAQNADIELAEAINQHQTVFKNKISAGIASFVTPVTIGVPLVLLTTGFLTHDKKYVKDALFVSGGYVLSGLLTTAIKKSFNERRPFDKHPDEVIYRNGTTGGASFPSGHTSAAFNLATSLALRYRKPIVIIPAFLYAGTMGWARIYQGVHYPSDVLTGAVVGAGAAWISYKLQKLLDKKHHY